jgi:hypothetical protein
VTAEPIASVEVPPAFLYQPPRVRSLVTQVDRISRTVGRQHDPEQLLAIDVLTGMKADGVPAALEGVVICARQNLKTYVLENIVVTRMVDPGDSARLFIWTSQQLDTAQESFLHFVSIFDNPAHPHMRRRLKKITSGNGSEQIDLVDGRRLKFKARSDKSGQGLTGDVLVFDEAFALRASHMASLVPTLSTRKRAQLLFGSSAGHPDSEVLRGLRDRGRKGGPGAPAYIEWCAPGSFARPGCELENCRHTTDMPGCVLDREDYVQMANPLAGRRITWDYLRDERRALPPLEYARERLGWWDEPDDGGAPPITVEEWNELADSQSAVPGDAPVVLAAEIAIDRRSGSIGVAGWRTDGTAHVELIDHRQGTDWLLGALLGYIERNTLHRLKRGKVTCPAVVIDPTSPAGTLVDPLRKAGIEPVLMQTREAGVAAAGLQDAVTDRTVRHRGQPAVSAALAGAVKRDLGDGGWAFGRKKSAAQSVDITPLVVVANARWALTEASSLLPMIF